MSLQWQKVFKGSKWFLSARFDDPFGRMRDSLHMDPGLLDNPGELAC